MLKRQEHILVRWFFGVSLLLVILDVGAALVQYPLVVSTAGGLALVYLTLFVVATLVYGWFTLFRARAATPEAQIALEQGTRWGLICGGAWSVELVVANLTGPQLGWLNLVLYYGSALTGYLLPGLAGFLAAQCARRLGVGLRAGLLCGMFGGIMIFLASMALSALLLAAGQHDPLTIHEFQRSGLPDLETYIVGDYLAGMIAHLWIGLLTGLVFGAVGGVLGKAAAGAQIEKG